MLEAGDYTVSVRRNVRQSVAEEQLPLAERKVLRYDDKTGAPIQNLFSDVNGEITYFSRSNPEATYPQGPMTKLTDAVRNADTEPAPKTEAPCPPRARYMKPARLPFRMFTATNPYGMRFWISSRWMR